MKARKSEKTGHKPAISVIVCTYNRKKLLEKNLESLSAQTLDKKLFEVVLIDDGSTDGSAQVAESFSGRIPLRYFRQQNSGLSSARNHGLFASRGDIVFFFDDDDTAAPKLLEEHLKAHRQHPDENAAVLNHTSWHPDLKITPLMHFITEVGCFLFDYTSVQQKAAPDYTYFWGGRISCKRSLLLKHGIFRPDIRIHYEDIELGYRLACRAGLKVIHHPPALSFMARAVSFDDFCRRMIIQGRSACLFAKIHNCPEVRQYCETDQALERWEKIAPQYVARVRAARELDRFATLKNDLDTGLDDDTRRLLYQSYQWVFRASKLKGIIEALKSENEGRRAAG